MKVRQAISSFISSNWQTKIFIMMSAVYMIALLWTTVQAYVRLEYNRSDFKKPIMIQASSDDKK